ncbi:c-type cytochrome [Sulfuricurvum sp.]|uniref:c-type cytochrome n=1 Tax=Sulfuricurvum sp. TaxID=2025608 RepID=UPI0026188936|nr:c-type cytochrome [Sulfuricurvum sp.]MDD2266249.1 c-type cytochrome [Sulfuricurvum sp.]MDD2783662.1 c-type cytochrome [Sulfuricurvum sp.]HZF69522.1 c-type cytochrome [Sulfuricurvum sp.]
MRKIILLIFPMIALMAAPSAYEQGKKLYFSKGCNGCHGISAEGTNIYPALAYRRKALLTSKLKRLRSKQGDTQLAQLMIPFAMKLTDSQIDAITTFLSEYYEQKSKKHYEPDDSNTGDGSS